MSDKRYPDYAAFITFVLNDARFAPFHQMFQEHEWLSKFVYHEKSLAGPILEERVVIDSDTGEWVNGNRCDTSMPIDAYYPGVWSPFFVKGIWLPLNKGQLFSLLETPFDCPLVQNHEGQDNILFLIHPKSEHLYQSLLKKNKKPLMLSAFALSSVRSLLLALPTHQNTYIPILVKVSLDQYTNGVHRLLSTRECALSVANTLMLREKISDIKQTDHAFSLDIFEDVLSYIPEGYSYGFIYRVFNYTCRIDQSFSTAKNKTHVIPMPLLGLLGVKNRECLKNLVKQNDAHNNVTSFLRQHLLEPMAHIIVTLLREGVSIEAHGQNLMLLVNEDYQIQQLLYRDMGGVNQRIDYNHPMLFSMFSDSTFDYFKRFKKDAAQVLEYAFVGRILFALTKQLVKAARYFSAFDSDFKKWHLKMRRKGYLENWTLDNCQQDTHKSPMSVQEYYRYGYVETLFGECLIDYLKQIGLIDAKLYRVFRRALLQDEIQFDGSLSPPCTIGPFFTYMSDWIIDRFCFLAQ